MQTATIQDTIRQEAVNLPAEYLDPRWYAAYTSSNHEKRVALQLTQRSIEHFLPLYESVRRWKDRRMKLQLPLFPGYVFVHIALQDRLRVLQIPSVVHFVGFSGLPCSLSDEEIETLRYGLGRQPRVEPHPYLRAGRRVLIKRGPFQGLEGFLVRKKGNFRVVLSVELIMRSVAVELDAAEIEVVQEVRRSKRDRHRSGSGYRQRAGDGIRSTVSAD